MGDFVGGRAAAVDGRKRFVLAHEVTFIMTGSVLLLLLFLSVPPVVVGVVVVVVVVISVGVGFDIPTIGGRFGPHIDNLATLSNIC